MKRSTLLARLATLQAQHERLREQRSLHHTKRDPEWQGRAEELGGGVDRLAKEIADVEHWLAGHWAEDDVA